MLGNDTRIGLSAGGTGLSGQALGPAQGVAVHLDQKRRDRVAEVAAVGNLLGDLDRIRVASAWAGRARWPRGSLEALGGADPLAFAVDHGLAVDPNTPRIDVADGVEGSLGSDRERHARQREPRLELVVTLELDAEEQRLTVEEILAERLFAAQRDGVEAVLEQTHDLFEPYRLAAVRHAIQRQGHADLAGHGGTGRIVQATRMHQIAGPLGEARAGHGHKPRESQGCAEMPKESAGPASSVRIAHGSRSPAETPTAPASIRWSRERAGRGAIGASVPMSVCAGDLA